MRTRDLIAELQRFDPDAPVAVSTDTATYFVSDVGRRERSVLGVHPVIYLVAKAPDLQEIGGSVPIGFCPVGRCIKEPNHAGVHLDGNENEWTDEDS